MPCCHPLVERRYITSLCVIGFDLLYGKLTRVIIIIQSKCIFVSFYLFVCQQLVWPYFGICVLSLTPAACQRLPLVYVRSECLWVPNKLFLCTATVQAQRTIERGLVQADVVFPQVSFYLWLRSLKWIIFRWTSQTFVHPVHHFNFCCHFWILQIYIDICIIRYKVVSSDITHTN